MYFMDLRIGSAYKEDKEDGSAKGAYAISIENPSGQWKDTSRPISMNHADARRIELLALITALSLAQQRKAEMVNDPIFIVTIMSSSLDLVRTMTDDRAILEPENVSNIYLIRDAVDLENAVTERQSGLGKARVQYVCVQKDRVRDVQRMAQRAANRVQSEEVPFTW